MLLYGGAVEKIRLICGDDGFISGEAGLNAHGIAKSFADEDNAHASEAVIDHIDEVGVGGFIADNRVARNEDGVLATGENHSRG